MDGQESSSEIDNGSSLELDLPEGFATKVLLLARAERRRRGIRRNLVVTFCVLLAAAIPASTLLKSQGKGAGAKTARAFQQQPWRGEPQDEAVAYKFTQASSTESAEDVLFPDTKAMSEFAYTYIDASWHYDPYWIDAR